MNRIDIRNKIIEEISKVLKFKSYNTKLTPTIVFDSLCYILRNAVNWNTTIVINKGMINTNTIYKHFRYLTHINFFDTFLRNIVRDLYTNTNANIIDSTFFANKRLHHSQMKNLKRNPHYLSKYGVKLSILINTNNIPISLLFVSGNMHDLTILRQQLYKPFYIHKNCIKSQTPLLADNGYNSKDKHLKFDIMTPKTPNKTDIYNKRIKIEHLNSKIKNYKRIAFIYENHIEHFKSFVYLAIILLLN
jgi:hypothetical protein